MTVKPTIIRHRVVQACFVLLALAAAPSIVGALIPSASTYVPPFALSALALLSLTTALLVWRLEWVVSKLFPGQQLPATLPFSARERRTAAVSACAGLVVTAMLVALWLRSLP